MRNKYLLRVIYHLKIGKASQLVVTQMSNYRAARRSRSLLLTIQLKSRIVTLTISIVKNMIYVITRLYYNPSFAMNGFVRPRYIYFDWSDNIIISNRICRGCLDTRYVALFTSERSHSVVATFCALRAQLHLPSWVCFFSVCQSYRRSAAPALV